VKKVGKIMAALLITVLLVPLVKSEENRDLWPLSTFIQSAKIQYQHVYRKTKLREDLYWSIDLLREASERFGHVPQISFMLGLYFAEINAIDTMSAYFDSAMTYCADTTIDKKYRKNCYKKDNYAKVIANTRLDCWEKSYEEARGYLEQYDTIAARLERTVDEDSIRVLDSMKAVAFDLCLHDFEQAVVAKPEEPKSLGAIGILYQRENQNEKAVEYYKKALELEGESADGVSKVAYAYIFIPNWDSSIVWFEKLLEYDSTNTSALNNLSISYSSINDYDKSYEYTEKLLELEPKNTQSLFNAGQHWFLQMQDAAAAMADVSDSLPGAKAKKKEMEELTAKHRDKATGYFERILEVNPEDIDALRPLGILYLLGQKFEDAAAAFAKNVEVNPDDNDALDYLGRTYIQMGDFKRAVDPYEKLLENDPGNLDAWERIEELYRYTDQPDKAENAKAKIEELKKL
jgi:tetratricopeptide (TPR) repeat protein